MFRRRLRPQRPRWQSVAPLTPAELLLGPPLWAPEKGAGRAWTCSRAAPLRGAVQGAASPVSTPAGDRTVQLPLDAKRSPGALKYLFTELLCAKCGGPEVMTAPSLPETRLLCSSKELFQLIRCAEEARSFPPPLTSHDPHSASPEARAGLTRGPLPWQASDHLRVGSYRTELMQLVFAQREMLLDPQVMTSRDLPRPPATF